jgi:hypothetical protein
MQKIFNSMTYYLANQRRTSTSTGFVSPASNPSGQFEMFTP